jgi:hypothetical protein
VKLYLTYGDLQVAIETITHMVMGSINNQLDAACSFFYYCLTLYMFRVLFAPIIRSIFKNCTYSLVTIVVVPDRWPGVGEWGLPALVVANSSAGSPHSPTPGHRSGTTTIVTKLYVQFLKILLMMGAKSTRNM